MSCLHKLNWFAVLQHDARNATANGHSTELHSTGPNTTSKGIEPIVYHVDVFEVTVRLVGLDTIRVSVLRIKDIAIAAVATTAGTPCASFANFAPTATPAQPHVPIVELEMAHSMENRVEAPTSQGSQPLHAKLVLYMACRHGSPLPCSLARPSQIFALALHLRVLCV